MDNRLKMDMGTHPCPLSIEEYNEARANATHVNYKAKVKI